MRSKEGDAPGVDDGDGVETSSLGSWLLLDPPSNLGEWGWRGYAILKWVALSSLFLFLLLPRNRVFSSLL